MISIGGITLHAAFGFKFGFEFRHLSDKQLALYRKNLSLLKLIIIDEVSLIASDMLYMIHLRLCEIFQTEELFGGISILLVGDLLQLPPVKAREVFAMPKNPHYQPFYQVCNLWEQFEPFVFECNHRQKAAKSWADVLNRFRVGIVTKEDEDLLKTRITYDTHLDEHSMHVFYTNKEVKDLNDLMMGKLSTHLVSIPSIKALPKGYRPYIHPDTNVVDTTQFHDILEVKVGVKCMLVFNINLLDGLVNGSTGILVRIEYNKHGNVECLVIKFDDDDSGEEQRKTYPQISRKYESQRGTPIFRFELEYPIKARAGWSHAANAKIVQFPVKLAYASTAHKMQVTLLNC